DRHAIAAEVDLRLAVTRERRVERSARGELCESDLAGPTGCVAVVGCHRDVGAANDRATETVRLAPTDVEALAAVAVERVVEACRVRTCDDDVPWSDLSHAADRTPTVDGHQAIGGPGVHPQQAITVERGDRITQVRQLDEHSIGRSTHRRTSRRDDREG